MRLYSIESFIIVVLIVFSIMFIYWGTYSSTYIDNYVPTIGRITEKQIQTISNVIATKQISGINVFTNEVKYRLKNIFEFHVNGKHYESHFYNDSENLSNYVDIKLIKKIKKRYPVSSRVRIYYNKYNKHDTYLNIGHIKYNNSKFYYLCSLMPICTLLFYLFFSDFFINE